MAFAQIAQIWEELSGHVDTSNVLRETIGRYELSVAGADNSNAYYMTVQLFVWLAVFLDLQRINAISSHQKDKRLLINSELLLAVVTFACKGLERICRGPTSPPALAPEATNIMMHIILSGLRAFILTGTGHRVPQEKSEIFTTTLRQLRNLPLETSHHSAIDVCRDAIKILLSQNPPRTPSFSGFDLPSGPQDRPLQQMAKFNTEMQVICGEARESWTAAKFWDLCDGFAELEAKLIKTFPERGKPESDFSKLLPMKESLLAELKKIRNHAGTANAYEAICLGSTIWFHQTLESSLSSQVDARIFFRRALEDMSVFQHNRNNELIRRDKSSHLMARFFTNSMGRWRYGTGEVSRSVLPLCDTTFVLNCARFHAVAGDVLAGKIAEDEQDIQRLESTDLMVNLDIECPFLDHGAHSERERVKSRRVTLAVKIRPLTDMHLQLQERIRRVQEQENKGIPDSLLQQSVGHTGANTLRDVESVPEFVFDRQSHPNTPRSASISSDGTNRRNRSFTNFFSTILTQSNHSDEPTRSTSRRHEHHHAPGDYKFDTSGKHLLLWTHLCDTLYRADVTSFRNAREDLPCTQMLVEKVDLVSGGDQFCAALSRSGGKTDTLLLFQSCRPKLNASPKKDAVTGLAISYNDSWLAVSYGTRVRLHDLGLNRLDVHRELSLSCSSKPRNQVLNFTRDGTKIAILSVKDNATKDMVIDVFGVAHGEVIAKRGEEQSLRLIPDGLPSFPTSVHFVPALKMLMISAISNKGYNVLHHTHPGTHIANWQEFRRRSSIQDLVIGPNQMKAFFVDDTGKLYEVDLQDADKIKKEPRNINYLDEKKHQHSVMTKKGDEQDGFKEYVKLAAVEDDTILAFWIKTNGKKRQMKYLRIKPGQIPEQKEVFIVSNDQIHAV